MTLTHGSLFSGIGGFDLGFERSGFSTKWQAETEPLCQAVLKTRFPEAKLFGDIKECGVRNLERVDVITGGVPCQDWSVAGKRAGIAGARSGLFFEFARIVGELRPSWFVFENVPGLLSSNSGRDFGIVLSTMAGLGYGLSYRILDSRHFGVAQRRRRVFLVGSFGSMRSAQVLLEPEGGGGDTEARGEAGQDVAFALAASVRGTGDGHGNAWNSNYAVGINGSGLRGRQPGSAATYVASPLCASNDWSHGRGGAKDEDNLVARSITSTCDRRHDDDTDTYVVAPLDGKMQRGGCASDFPTGIVIKDATIGRNPAAGQHAVAFSLRESDGHHGRSSPRGDGCDNLVATLNSGGNSGGFRTEPGEHLTVSAAPDADGMRNFAGLPEGMDGAERQALKDWAEYQPRNGDEFGLLPKGLDSARYRALGNAVTVSVAEWIAKRIAATENGHGFQEG